MKGGGTFGMIVRVKEVSALTPPLMTPERVTVKVVSTSKPSFRLI